MSHPLRVPFLAGVTTGQSRGHRERSEKRSRQVDEYEGHNPVCHEVEREVMVTEVRIIVRRLLDGDDLRIRQIENAIDALPKAA